MGRTGRLYAQFWSMLLLFGVHMLRGTSICWSLFRAGRLDGYVAAVGSQLIHHGQFHPVIAALNLTFPLYKLDVIIYLYASSMISIINIPHFHLTSFVISTQLPSRSHHLSLIPPTSTINSRRFSFFVNTTFLWNSIPIHILEDRNTKSFRHSLYNYLCNN